MAGRPCRARIVAWQAPRARRTESSVITLAGGFSGILLGYLLSALVNAASSWPMQFNGVAAAVGFCSAVAIGVVFGSYPALQAAAVSPVRSLNDL